jgi:hypothetical protein
MAAASFGDGFFGVGSSMGSLSMRKIIAYSFDGACDAGHVSLANGVLAAYDPLTAGF